MQETGGGQGVGSHNSVFCLPSRCSQLRRHRRGSGGGRHHPGDRWDTCAVSGKGVLELWLTSCTGVVCRLVWMLIISDRWGSAICTDRVRVTSADRQRRPVSRPGHLFPFPSHFTGQTCSGSGDIITICLLCLPVSFNNVRTGQKF